MRPRMTGQPLGLLCLFDMANPPTLAGIGLACLTLMSDTLTVAGAAQAGGRITASCFPFNFRRTTAIGLDSRCRIGSTEGSKL